jgi:hypothetical protein
MRVNITKPCTQIAYTMRVPATGEGYRAMWSRSLLTHPGKETCVN